MDITLPDLGENIEGGDVLSILATVGKDIKAESAIIEIETDKATLEVPCPEDGRLEKILVKKGDFVKVGQVFAVLAESEKETKEKNEDKNEGKKEAAPIKEQDGKEKSESGDSSTKKTSEKPSGKTTKQTIVLPEMGEGIESGAVLNVFVKTGQNINIDDALLEIETDKATLEVPSSHSGVVSKIFAKAGNDLKVGEAILELDASDANEQKTAPPEPSKTDSASATSKETPKDQSGESSRETEKSSDDEQTEAKEESNTKLSKDNPLTPDKKKKKVPAAPSVRRFAYEIGIEVTDVPGSGPGGRISIDDVKAYSKKINSERSQAPTSLGHTQRKLPDFKKFGALEIQDMNKIREITAAQLSYSWQSIPHVTQFGKADITDMEALRQKYKKQVEAKGGKLTITTILAKVVSTALKEFPQFNSSVDMDNKQIIQKKYYNVGLAVDTPNGLIVPVIKNTDKKNITELALEISDVAKRSRDRKITPTDLQGGTFTITNLGGIGGTAFTPVVNWPEVAILGVSKSEYEPVYKEGKFIPRLMMPLSLSYDHRVIDGADGARFLNYLVNALQDPFVLALEG